MQDSIERIRSALKAMGASEQEISQKIMIASGGARLLSRFVEAGTILGFTFYGSCTKRTDSFANDLDAVVFAEKPAALDEIYGVIRKKKLRLSLRPYPNDPKHPRKTALWAIFTPFFFGSQEYRLKEIKRVIEQVEKSLNPEKEWKRIREAYDDYYNKPTFKGVLSKYSFMRTIRNSRRTIKVLRSIKKQMLPRTRRMKNQPRLPRLAVVKHRFLK